MPAAARIGRLDAWLKAPAQSPAPVAAVAQPAAELATTGVATPQSQAIDLTADSGSDRGGADQPQVEAGIVEVSAEACAVASTAHPGTAAASSQAVPRRNAFDAMMTASQGTPSKAQKPFVGGASMAERRSKYSGPTGATGAAAASMFDWERKACSPWITTFCRWVANPALISRDEPHLYVRFPHRASRVGIDEI